MRSNRDKYPKIRPEGHQAVGEDMDTVDTGAFPAARREQALNEKLASAPTHPVFPGTYEALPDHIRDRQVDQYYTRTHEPNPHSSAEEFSDTADTEPQQPTIEPNK